MHDTEKNYEFIFSAKLDNNIWINNSTSEQDLIQDEYLIGTEKEPKG